MGFCQCLSCSRGKVLPQVSLLPPQLPCSNMSVLLHSFTAQHSWIPVACAAPAGAKVMDNLVSHNSKTVPEPTWASFSVNISRHKAKHIQKMEKENSDTWWSLSKSSNGMKEMKNWAGNCECRWLVRDSQATGKWIASSYLQNYTLILRKGPMLCGALCCAFHQLFSFKHESFGSYFLSKALWQCICELPRN